MVLFLLNRAQHFIVSAQSQPPSKAQHVSLGKRFFWGCGGIADNFMMNAVITLVMPIYNIGFGVSAVWLGFITAIPRLLDAVTDPLMGNISDNTRSRLGRRKPYIIIGTIICAVLFPLLWIPPFKSETGMLVWFCLLYITFTLSYTVYVVPYTALGIELTSNYDERTRVMAWRMYLGLLASMAVPWIYRASRLEIFGGDETIGIRYISIGIAALIIVFGLAPGLFCKERVHVTSQEKIRLSDAVKMTIKNRPFSILLVSYIFILVGLFIGGSFGLYVNIYYVFNGDKSAAATITGIAGTCTAIASYFSLFLSTWLSTHYGKRTAMITGLALGICGGCSLWFTMSPSYPYAQLFSAVIIGLGLQGCWLMVSSMTADICDLDELNTGLKREGLYSAVVSFTQKLAFALIAAASGIFLRLSGYQEAISPSAETIFNMRLMLVGLIAGGLLLGLILMLRYPITREQAESTRRSLDTKMP